MRAYSATGGASTGAGLSVIVGMGAASMAGGAAEGAVTGIPNLFNFTAVVPSSSSCEARIGLPDINLIMKPPIDL